MKVLFLSLLTRKRFIFHMLLAKQRNDFRVIFNRLERGLGGECKVTSLKNSLTRYKETRENFQKTVYYNYQIIAMHKTKDN